MPHYSDKPASTVSSSSLIRSRTRLLWPFAGFTRASSVRFDDVPDREENLSRFIFSSSHFNTGQRRVKPDAFLPSRNQLETSVFRTADLNTAEVRQIGDMVGTQTGRNLKAWGDVLAGVVFDVGLAVRPDNNPERHAAIVGWPAEKDERLSLAQRLAAAAMLRLPS
jgi:hypothetical protein